MKKLSKEEAIDKFGEDTVNKAMAFLSDETAVNVRLIQFNAHGLFKFVYVLKVRLL